MRAGLWTGGRDRDAAGSARPRLLADRDARLYLGGQIASMIGDSSLWLAIGIWIKELTGSSSQAALVWFAFILGGLTGPVSSILVDRLPLRTVLIITNLVGAADVLLLLFVRGPDTAWLAYPVMFCYGVCNALLQAATSAFLTPMFGKGQLARANAALTTAKQSMNLVAPLLGAGLFAVVGARPVIIADAVTFAVAATAIWLVRRKTSPATNAAGSRSGGWAMVSAGMRHVMGTPAIRRIVFAVSAAVLGLGFLTPAQYSVNSEGLDRPPAFLGLLFGFQGAGALLGGLVVARVTQAIGMSRTAALGLAGAAAGIAGMAVPSLPAVLASFTLYGAALTWIVVAQQTQLQRLTPPDKQGRAAGAANLLTKTPQAVGIAVGAAIIGMTGYVSLLLLIAVITGSAAVWLLTVGRREGSLAQHGEPPAADGGRS